MQRSYLKTTLGIILVLISSQTLADSNPDKAQLRTIIEAVRVGWIEADASPFRKYFLDYQGARYFEGGGENTGLDDLISHHVEPEADAFESFSLDFNNIETHVENDFAWALVDTEIKAKLKSDGREIHNKGRGTYIFRKVGDDWKVIHTNSASRPVKKKQHKH